MRCSWTEALWEKSWWQKEWKQDIKIIRKEPLRVKSWWQKKRKCEAHTASGKFQACAFLALYSQSILLCTSEKPQCFSTIEQEKRRLGVWLVMLRQWREFRPGGGFLDGKEWGLSFPSIWALTWVLLLFQEAQEMVTPQHRQCCMFKS